MKNRKTTPDNKFISIIKGTTGYTAWRVRLPDFPWEGKIYKEFAFKNKKESGEAFKKAKRHRNKVLRHYGAMNRLKTKLIKPRTYSIRNKSGVVGIHLDVTKRETTSEYFSWIASYQYKNILHHRGFGINKYGMETSFLMACEIRASKTGRLVIANENVLPVSIKQISNYLDGIIKKENILII